MNKNTLKHAASILLDNHCFYGLTKNARDFSHESSQFRKNKNNGCRKCQQESTS